MSAPQQKKETAYPEKTRYKLKGLKLDAAAHAESLTNAFKTTRDIAAQIREEFAPFVRKARARVNELILIIQDLRREIKAARETLIASNKDDLYPSLMVIEEVGDPLFWSKGEEFIEPK
ncbi:hypothetical protein QBC34DRAFT_448183 [Podospora aff. communis PSN243]|uniref:Uncharacterized protein n=1 Tax=Podospora aff. communis PSN243 TaxID=3040156 RepID=A0AAV9GQD5_9PEZI|nr:hypothetical protein QBC34DRAFT_448183 [Podospora aff. communis PSN243]